LKEAIISDPKYKEEIRKNLFETLAHTIQAGFGTIEEDSKQLEDKDETTKEGMMREMDNRKNALSML
jgi:hypothetical protein